MTDRDRGDDPSAADAGESTLGDRLAALHEALVATEELPVDRDAARWIGEAQAVAADAAAGDLDPDVARERVWHVRDLLANVDGTGHEEADRLVDRAKRLAGEISGES